MVHNISFKDIGNFEMSTLSIKHRTVLNIALNSVMHYLISCCKSLLRLENGFRPCIALRLSVLLLLPTPLHFNNKDSCIYTIVIAHTNTLTHTYISKLNSLSDNLVFKYTSQLRKQLICWYLVSQ